MIIFNYDKGAGLLYAVVDGAFCGMVFGWLYNLFVGKGSSAQAVEPFNETSRIYKDKRKWFLCRKIGKNVCRC